ncbi:MAG: hydrogenase maturation nickel metallochaperone HypA [Desulfomonilia bacterium]|jgi:hydrogenase nickel incorporation protein HypA/HybF
MHEMSLVSSVLDIVEDYASRHRFGRVDTVRLSFGALSGIDPAALRFAFEVLSGETRCRGAALELKVVPARVYCLACGGENEVEGFPADCPHCGSAQVTPTGGFDGLRLEELDVDNE